MNLATVDQIAICAGMTKPNLLYYFRRKTDIYLAVLNRTHEMWLQPLEALRAEWETRLNAQERQEFKAVAGRRVRSREPAATVRETLTHALRHGFERQSVMAEKRLLATALKRGYGSVGPEEPATR